MSVPDRDVLEIQGGTRKSARTRVLDDVQPPGEVLAQYAREFIGRGSENFRGLPLTGV